MVATTTRVGKVRLALITRTLDGLARVAFDLDGVDYLADIEPRCLRTLPLFQAAVWAACGVPSTAVETFAGSIVEAGRGASE